jgi:hypothetical protein
MLAVDAKHRLARVAGILLLLIGPLGGFALLGGLVRHRPATIWDAGDFSFALALAVYVVYIGSRTFRWGIGQNMSAVRIKWGRVLLGVWLIFTQAKNHFHPGNLFTPSSPGEALGMLIAEILITLVGMVLIFSGLRPELQRILAKKMIG